MKIMIEMISRVPSVIPMIASVESFDLVFGWEQVYNDPTPLQPFSSKILV